MGFWFWVDFIFAIPLGIWLLKTYLMGTRGTNALTRTVRDSMANRGYTLCLGVGAALTMLCTLLGCITKKFWAGLPTLLVCVGCIACMFISKNNKQRVQDSRVVTKGSLKVAGATAQAAGTVAGGLAGGAAGAKAGAAIGGVVGQVSDNAANMISDVEAPDVPKIEIKDPEAFLAACQRAGIKTNGKDLGAVAQQVIAAAPTALIEQTSNLTPEQQAKVIMLGGGN